MYYAYSVNAVTVKKCEHENNLIFSYVNMYVVKYLNIFMFFKFLSTVILLNRAGSRARLFCWAVFGPEQIDGGSYGRESNCPAIMQKT